jgi:hypothetical protein
LESVLIEFLKLNNKLTSFSIVCSGKEDTSSINSINVKLFAGRHNISGPTKDVYISGFVRVIYFLYRNCLEKPE